MFNFVSEALSITKQVETINQKEFVAIVLNLDKKSCVIYIVFLYIKNINLSSLILLLSLNLIL